MTILCTFGPPNERQRYWILKFEDADVGDMHFKDEVEAMQAFRKFEVTYTCTLFVTASYDESLKYCPWCGVVHTAMCARLISGGQSD